MKLAHLFMAVAPLSLAGAFGIAATPASATTAAVNAKAAAISIDQAGASKAPAACPVENGFFSTWDSTCAGTLWSCAHGTSSSLFPPMFASNGCGTRVWLYQNSNRTGYTLCITKGTATGHLNRTYRAFWVSSNTANC